MVYIFTLFCLNLQDKLQCHMCIGKTSQLAFFFEFIKTNPSSVVMEVKNFFCPSGELDSRKLEENPI